MFPDIPVRRKNQIFSSKISPRVAYKITGNLQDILNDIEINPT